jgi:flagellar FliL protein
MVDEVDVEAEPKAKKPILLIVGGVVVLLLVVVGAVVGTLFATGFFKPKPVLTAEQMLEGGGAVDTAGDPAHKDKDGKGTPPAKQTKKSPELTRFDYTYMQLDREFLVNLVGSRKVMSVQVAIMTRYDKRVIDNVKKHEFALRSVVMDVMRQTVDADLNKPEFRKELAVQIRDVMNTLLEKYEDFGGIEDVYFTSFIVQ